MIEFKKQNIALNWFQKSYELYFNGVRGFVNFLSKKGLRALGSTIGMIALEGFTLIKTFYKMIQYNKDPISYGFNQLSNEHLEKKPIILIHGAAGNYRYMGDFAKALLKEKRPVFVINLGLGAPNEEKRAVLQSEILKIQNQYLKTFNKETKVDVVAHSMGGLVALSSMFTNDTSFIDQGGEVFEKESTELKSFDAINRLVTIAMPLDTREIELLKKTKKDQQVFSILAKYEELMDMKKSAINEENTTTLDSAHIGIVYNQDLVKNVIRFLA
jgi:hypothetical protein